MGFVLQVKNPAGFKGFLPISASIREACQSFQDALRSLHCPWRLPRQGSLLRGAGGVFQGFNGLYRVGCAENKIPRNQNIGARVY